MKQEKDKILVNFRQSKIISVTFNIIAAGLFLFSYYITKTIWFLIASVVLLLASLIFVLYVSKLQRKYLQRKNRSKPEVL